MKPGLYRVTLVALLAGTLVAVSCGDKGLFEPDEPRDPGVLCNEDLCRTDDALKDRCVETFTTCLTENLTINDDECAAAALLICGVE